MEAPKTLRDKFTRERDELYHIRSGLSDAINELLAGELTASYSIGNRSVTKTRANLKDMQDSLKRIDQRIDELEALLSGRAVRSTQTHSYVQPAATWFSI